MPCFSFHDPKSQTSGFVCTGSRGRGQKCFAAPAHYGAFWLCDFPVGPGKTCDRLICERHRRNIGPEKDYCLEHALKK